MLMHDDCAAYPRRTQELLHIRSHLLTYSELEEGLGDLLCSISVLITKTLFYLYFLSSELVSPRDSVLVSLAC